MSLGRGLISQKDHWEPEHVRTSDVGGFSQTSLETKEKIVRLKAENAELKKRLAGANRRIQAEASVENQVDRDLSFDRDSDSRHSERHEHGKGLESAEKKVEDMKILNKRSPDQKGENKKDEKAEEREQDHEESAVLSQYEMVDLTRGNDKYELQSKAEDLIMTVGRFGKKVNAILDDESDAGMIIYDDNNVEVF